MGTPVCIAAHIFQTPDTEFLQRIRYGNPYTGVILVIIGSL
jgi:hypothetical protein